MLPKFEPMLEPAFLSRHTAVRSINPIGTRHVLPSRMNAGVWPSGFASHGFADAAFGACDALLTAATGAAATGVGAGGMNGVVLATSPSGALLGGKATWLSGAGAALLTRSSIFICSCSTD